MLQNANGEIYRRYPRDLYLIEIMAPRLKTSTNDSSFSRAIASAEKSKPLHNILSILPTLNCLTPRKTYQFLSEAQELGADVCPLLFDAETLRSDIIQRPCQYLQAADKADQNFDQVHYSSKRHLNPLVCLDLLLKHLETTDPSWSEIVHFATFLNRQVYF